MCFIISGKEPQLFRGSFPLNKGWISKLCFCSLTITILTLDYYSTAHAAQDSMPFTIQNYSWLWFPLSLLLHPTYFYSFQDLNQTFHVLLILVTTTPHTEGLAWRGKLFSFYRIGIGVVLSQECFEHDLT